MLIVVVLCLKVELLSNILVTSIQTVHFQDCCVEVLIFFSFSLTSCSTVPYDVIRQFQHKLLVGQFLSNGGEFLVLVY